MSRPQSGSRHGFSATTVAFAFALFLAALLLASFVSARNVQGLVENTDKVSQTHLVIAQLERITGDVTTTTSSCFSYLLTGRQRALDVYSARKANVRKGIDQGLALTIDNSRQQERLRTLDRILDDRFRWMDSLVEKRGVAGAEAAKDLYLSGGGRLLTPQVLALLDEAKAEEVRLLSERNRSTGRRVAFASQAFWLSTGVGLVLLLATFIAVQRYLASERHQRMIAAAHAAELEEKVEDRTADLLRLNQELEAFSYSVSHDLRAPLRAIAAYTRMVEEDLEPHLGPESQSHLQRITASTKKMAGLIQDLLNLSTVARETVVPVKIDLSRTAVTVLKDLEQRQPRPGVTVHIQVGMVNDAAPGMMAILLENLLGNAWKFTSARRDAVIEFGKEDERYFVRDNGVGFDPKNVKRIFEPFQRLHPATEFEGTGIGLAICSRIVSRHDGRIWAETELGRGTTIYFTLWTERATRERSREDSNSVSMR